MIYNHNDNHHTPADFLEYAPAMLPAHASGLAQPEVESTQVRCWILVASSVLQDPHAEAELDRLVEAGRRLDADIHLLDADHLILESMNGGQVRLRHAETQDYLEHPDFVLTRTGARTPRRVLEVLDALESLGVRTLASWLGIFNSQHKWRAQRMVSRCGVPVADASLVALTHLHDRDVISHSPSGGFPVVLKAASGSCGEEVEVLYDEAELTGLRGRCPVPSATGCGVIQAFRGDRSRAADVRVFWLGSEPLGAMRRVGPVGSRVANVAKGASVEPFELDDELTHMSAAVMEQLDLEIAGLDYIKDPDRGWTFIEANSAPGLSGIQKAVDIDVAEAVMAYVLGA